MAWQVARVYEVIQFEFGTKNAKNSVFGHFMCQIWPKMSLFCHFYAPNVPNMCPYCLTDIYQLISHVKYANLSDSEQIGGQKWAKMPKMA